MRLYAVAVLIPLADVDYEVSLLRLLERATNGTIIEISVTGELYGFVCA